MRTPFALPHKRYLGLAPLLSLLKLGLFTLSLLVLGLLGCAQGPNDRRCSEDFRLTWSDKSRLLIHVETLSSDQFAGRKTGTDGAAQARDYIAGQMQQAGLTPWLGRFYHNFEYDYQFGTRQGTNVIGILPASKPSDRWRLVVAHYDHLGKRGYKLYHGADDNASGIAGLLEIAAHSANQARDANLMFIATDAEEPGLYGSKAFVDGLMAPDATLKASQITLMINLDMIGRPPRNNRIYLEGRRGFEQFEQIKAQLEQSVNLCIRANHPPKAGKTIQRVDWLRASDHYPFHQAGIPWLYFGVPPHKDYHQPSDEASKIDVNFLAAVTETAYKLLIMDTYLLNN
ncbi:M28 family peptidase [Shewanella insulae]|uniref:M20/M25/M40 family metallo-hydrolase n=1 Tax=Shewanella insulae TaxID=2681496 RepID=UPI001EFDA0C5|nr:M20/M25/M40 family metallo-hydrolase [Shewanella insulae]MCG9755370.1 M28 family peptidase [Shewanella insulae]